MVTLVVDFPRLAEAQGVPQWNTHYKLSSHLNFLDLHDMQRCLSVDMLWRVFVQSIAIFANIAIIKSTIEQPSNIGVLMLVVSDY